MTRRLLAMAAVLAAVLAMSGTRLLAPLAAGLLYGLAAWLPGLVVWRALGRREADLVDAWVVPSCLSPPLFAGLAVAGMACGVSARRAALLALATFVVLAAAVGGVRLQRRGLAAVAGAVGLALVLLALPFAINGFAAPAWDAPMHAAITARIAAGHIPPDSPWVAGQSVNYYWFYHAYSTAISELTGLRAYQTFACLNVHFLVVLVLAGYRLASRLTPDRAGRCLSGGLVVFGLNPFGWIFFLQRAVRDPECWFSLRAPIEMVHGYPAALAGMVHEFLDGNPFPIAFPLMVVWLDTALAWLAGKRDRETIGVGGLTLLTLLHVHLFTAVFFLAAAGVATAAVVIAALAPLRRALALLPMVLTALACTVPYALDVLGARSAMPVQVEASLGFVGRQLLAVAASVGLLLLLAAPALRLPPPHALGPRIWLATHAAVLLAAACVLHMAGDTQYKLHYLASLALAPLVGAAWSAWARSGPTRTIAVLLLASCLPTSAIMSYAFLTQPPRERQPEEQRQLLQWIRESTPEDSAFVEAEYWIPLRRTVGDFLYYDRLWFDIPVYTARRCLVGYSDDVVLVDQWGYRDIPVRRRIARTLLAGRPLADDERAYLTDLDLPLFVIVRGSLAGPPAFDPETYVVAYARPGVSVFRVRLG